MPGLVLEKRESFNGRRPAAVRLHDEGQPHEGDGPEQHEHHRVGDHHAAGTRVQREQRVAQPGHHQGGAKRQAGHLVHDGSRALRHHDQVGRAAQDDRDPGDGLHAPAVEPLAEILGQGQGAAAAEEAAEPQPARHVTDAVDGGQYDQNRGVARVTETRFAHEGVGAHQAGDQRADDQQRGRLAAGHEIVLEVLDAPPRVVAHHQVDDDADQHAGREEVHGMLRIVHQALRSITHHILNPFSINHQLIYLISFLFYPFSHQLIYLIAKFFILYKPSLSIASSFF